MHADGIIAALFVTSIALAIWAIMERRTTASIRQQRNTLRGDLEAVVRDRDEWREAAKRSAYVADLFQADTVRSVVLAEKVVSQKT